MNEEHDVDYDREDLEHVENMLYANIHYNAGSNAEQSPSTNQSSASIEPTASTSNTPTQTGRRDSFPRKPATRYWTDKTTPSSTPNSNSGPQQNTNNTPRYKQYFKEKQSGVYKAAKNVTGNSPKVDVPKVDEISEPVNTTPKQFTPYVSFLPLNDSLTNAEIERLPTAPISKDEPKVLKTTNELIRKNLPTKQINPFSKKNVIDTYKSKFGTGDTEQETVPENKKRLNPFNPLSRKAKKKKSEPIPTARKARGQLKKEAANLNIIDVDDTDKDDDDVIILPTEAPPLICVDSSDEETSPTNAQEHAFTEPNAVGEGRRKIVSRCTSPSSSIQSADDFLAQNDQRSFGFEAFGTLSDDDLCQVSETLEIQLNKKNAQANADKRAPIPNDNDNAIFTPPKLMQKDKSKANTKKSYEVAANSFTAVDVYESESSDMPDSVYAKGVSGKRKNVSDSDSSSVESVAVLKSKRLRKRKSSGSAKESDHLQSQDSSSDDVQIASDDDDDEDTDDDQNENSYLVRGEALGKVKSSSKKKNKKNTNDKRSEDDFINKLSCIVNGQSESENEEVENSPETSVESVEARDIVETVLQKRSKRSKKGKNSDSEANSGGSSASTKWAVTDEIGETDELNIRQMINDTASESTSENASAAEKNAQLETESSPKVPSGNEPTNVSDEPTYLPIEAESGWNDEMRRFYNQSWGGETFSMKNIRSRMPRGFIHWMVINRDRYPSNDNRGRQFRCLNCQEKGHLAKNCPQPPFKKHCYMCGTEGHLEPRCPNKICLSCGRKSQKYSHGCADCSRDREMACYLCKQKGHRQLMCPDRWRRYHATTTITQQLLREKPSKSIAPTPKYCCLCANRGHYADACNRSNRARGPLSVLVSSYRPLFNETNTNLNEDDPKFTILTSSLDECKFNFANDVSDRGNTIYGRFRRAVNLDVTPTLDLTKSDDVEFVKEGNLLDTSDPPIELYDDEYTDDLDELSSSEQYSEDAGDESYITIDSIDEQNASTNDQEIDMQTNDNEEIKQLNDKMHNLEQMKGKLLSHKTSNDDNDSSSSTNHDSSTETIDTKQSVSGPKEDVITSTVLPDFIPLTSDEGKKYEPTRSPSPVSADSTTATEKSDATIHLTKEHFVILLSNKGGQFLRDSEKKCDVSVRLEWRQFGNVLIVNGIASSQQDFHENLKTYLNTVDKGNANSVTQVGATNLPRNRDALIKFLRENIMLLDSQLCNPKRMDAKTMLMTIRNNESSPSIRNTKKTCKLRKHLNMFLFGRLGLADGKKHLDALQNCLRSVVDTNEPKVSVKMYTQITEHVDYIFSSKDHGNYGDVIEEFHRLRDGKNVPPLMLDRKLVGLKITVLPSIETNKSTQKQENPFKNSAAPSTSRAPTSTVVSSQRNFNAAPSSSDIQINVSTPSNSYHDQNEPRHRNNYSSQTSNHLDKWKF